MHTGGRFQGFTELLQGREMIPTRITIHCTDSKDGERVDISEIRKWHLARGFKDIGYHAVIQPDGEVQHGRGLNEEGAHVHLHNDGNLGVCLVGRGRYTRAQWGSLRYLLESWLMNFHQIPKWAIYLHNQYDTAQKEGKTCPNMEINCVLYWYIWQDWKAIEPYVLKESER
jgi:N-acetylmuramoyl-L-alanine amidase